MDLFGVEGRTQQAGLGRVRDVPSLLSARYVWSERPTPQPAGVPFAHPVLHSQTVPPSRILRRSGCSSSGELSYLSIVCWSRRSTGTASNWLRALLESQDYLGIPQFQRM
jgi:hypothetical protein